MDQAPMPSLWMLLLPCLQAIDLRLHLFLPVKATALHRDEMRYREQSDGRQTSSLRLNERIAPRIEPDGCILSHGRI